MAKFCPMCGSNVSESATNCPMCGGLINISPEQMQMNNQQMMNTQYYNGQPMMNGQYYNGQPMMNGQYYNGQPMDLNKEDKFPIASLILGILSLVGSFIFSIFTFILSIPGLIFGIVGKGKKGTKCAGIILNILSIIVSLIILIFAFDLSEEENDISGFYKCKNFNGTGVSEEYTTVLDLNNDNTFLFGPYGKLENNYAKGTYTYVDEEKTNGSGDFKYYMITFTGNKNDFIVNGVPSDHDFNSKMEFGITEKNGKKEGIIIFTNNNNMYYCYES